MKTDPAWQYRILIDAKPCLTVPDDIKKAMVDIVNGLQKKLLKKSSAFDIESDNNVEADHEVAADSSGKRKSLREIPRKDMFKRGITTLTQTTINGV
ncbi:hypothetical protein L195_g006073 [Trifolium pratense]|uniref:Uncharacterized protein n=1 Tax=Trifolium pratense TaxID=57577 RepID=A0A2K3P2L0_TRIPR|nr:hypothetical protein L195_g006073 [Trifolium pratense]